MYTSKIEQDKLYKFYAFRGKVKMVVIVVLVVKQ